MREMTDVLRSAFQRALKRQNRRAEVRRGRLEHIHGFESAITGTKREITIYLPPGFDENVDAQYPVLYMQDGQNLFEDERAFAGRSWRLHIAADEAIAACTMRPAIIVGIDHLGEERVNEYTPTFDERREAGGAAPEYARMLIEEIKPLIEERYRALGDRSHVAIGGSSLGGLVSLFLLFRHPDVFGGGLVMSPSVWWGGRAILQDLEAFSGDLPRTWLDIGTREGREALSDARLLRNRMVARGWTSDRLRYHEERRGEHSEKSWGTRARLALEFLFPFI
jgi:predicted alpha/beta superfamily hydrolase